MPFLLGDGLPLTTVKADPGRLSLTSTRTFADGSAEQVYNVLR